MANVENSQVPSTLDGLKHTVHKGVRSCDLLFNLADPLKYSSRTKGMEQGPWMRKWVVKIGTATLVECTSLDGDPWLTLSDAIFKIFTKDCAVIMCIHDVHIVCSAQRNIWMMHWELFLKKGLSICKLLRLWEREGKKKIRLDFLKKNPNS